jgi:hypothetical protein
MRRIIALAALYDQEGLPGNASDIAAQQSAEHEFAIDDTAWTTG